MCVLRISFRVCMSAVQKLAIDLYLAVKDIPGTCSPINSLTKTIISKQRVVWQLIEERNGCVLGIMAGSVSGNNTKGLKLLWLPIWCWTPYSLQYRRICLKLFQWRYVEAALKFNTFAVLDVWHRASVCLTVHVNVSHSLHCSPHIQTSCTSVASPHNCNKTLCLAEKPTHSSSEVSYPSWTGTTNVFALSSASENHHVYVHSLSQFHILSL